MLLSVEHRFIFIKTKKTASTSLQIHLSQYLRGRHDIITPLLKVNEARYLGQKEKYLPGKNYAKPGAGKQTTNIREMDFWGHMPAWEIKEKLPPEIWNGYMKVTSERHPYEKAVSLAWFHFPWQDRYSTFSSLLDHIIGTGDYENWSRYSIDGQNIADIVLRYEYLVEDTARMLEALKLPPLKTLPSFFTQYSKDRRPATGVLSAAQKKRIQEICAPEFQYHGYAY